MKKIVRVKGFWRTKKGKIEYVRPHIRKVKSRSSENKTMFGKRKYEKYRDIVKIDTPKSAKESVEKLKQEFKEAKSYDKKLRIARVTQLAENSVGAMCKRKNLSSKEKAEFKKVSQIYSETADRLWKQIDNK